MAVATVAGAEPPSPPAAAQVIVLEKNLLDSSFARQSMRCEVDGKPVIEVEGAAQSAELGRAPLPVGRHTILLQAAYVGRSPVFQYVERYRFALRTRITVEVAQGDGVELQITADQSSDPTLDWIHRPRFRVDGKPRRAIIDIQDTPTLREKLHDGAAAVTPDEQKKDDEKARQAVAEVLAEADRQTARPKDPVPVGDAMCTAPVIHFDVARAKVGGASLRAVGVLAKCMVRHPAATVLIEGHCDERGSEDFNLKLGEQRAETVARHLLRRGVPREQLRIVSYGKDHPTCQEHTAACYAKNRRVVFGPGAAAPEQATLPPP